MCPIEGCRWRVSRSHHRRFFVRRISHDYGGVREVEQWAVGRGLGTLPLRHLFLMRRHLGLACHESPQPTLSPRRILGVYAACNELRTHRSLNKDPALRRPSRAACSASVSHLSAISMKRDLCSEVRAASANRMHSAALLRNWSKLGKSASISIDMETDRANRQRFSGWCFWRAFRGGVWSSDLHELKTWLCSYVYSIAQRRMCAQRKGHRGDAASVLLYAIGGWWALE